MPMRLVTLVLLLSFAAPALSQKADQAIDSFFVNHPQEKVVLALDKNVYLSGGTIFYKAYVLHGYNAASGTVNLYTELYNSKKQPVAQQIVQVKNGSGEGSFALPDTLGEDTYFIRAYTNYLLNFDEAFQCVKAVNVYNPASSFRLAPKPIQWTAAVFPEGGNMVDGIPTAVAVRLFSQGSLPEKWHATLETKNSKEPAVSVDVLTNELGVVRFRPSASADYVVKIVDNQGLTQEVSLPRAQSAGAVLQAWTLGRKLTYNVQIKNLPSNGKGFKIIGTSPTKRLFTASVVQSTGAVRGEVSVDSLEHGVVQLQLLDDKDIPLNSRLCFVQQSSVASPVIDFDTLSFSEKALNVWRVSIDTVNKASYRVQVLDAAHPFANDFLGDVYLTSDLPGVRNASWYFENADQRKLEALDALLMTESWKRYNCSDVMSGTYVFPFQNDSSLRFLGTFYSGKKPAALQNLALVFQGK